MWCWSSPHPLSKGACFIIVHPRRRLPPATLKDVPKTTSLERFPAFSGTVRNWLVASTSVSSHVCLFPSCYFLTLFLYPDKRVWFFFIFHLFIFWYLSFHHVLLLILKTPGSCHPFDFPPACFLLQCCACTLWVVACTFWKMFRIVDQ